MSSWVDDSGSDSDGSFDIIDALTEKSMLDPPPLSTKSWAVQKSDAPVKKFVDIQAKDLADTTVQSSSSSSQGNGTSSTRILLRGSHDKDRDLDRSSGMNRGDSRDSSGRDDIHSKGRQHGGDG